MVEIFLYMSDSPVHGLFYSLIPRVDHCLLPKTPTKGISRVSLNLAQIYSHFLKPESNTRTLEMLVFIVTHALFLSNPISSRLSSVVSSAISTWNRLYQNQSLTFIMTLLHCCYLPLLKHNNCPNSFNYFRKLTSLYKINTSFWLIVSSVLCIEAV